MPPLFATRTSSSTKFSRAKVSGVVDFNFGAAPIAIVFIQSVKTENVNFYRSQGTWGWEQ